MKSLFFCSLPNYGANSCFVSFGVGAWINPNNGLNYDPCIMEIGKITNGQYADESNATIKFTNSPVLSGGLTFNEVLAAAQIEGEQIQIYEHEISSAVDTLLFSGVVSQVSQSKGEVTLQCADLFVLLSKQINQPINTSIWPNARKSDVGKRFKTPFNEVVGLKPLVVVDYKMNKTAISIDRSTTVIAMNEVDNLSTGAASIEREEITIDSIDSVAKEITVTRTQPSLHGQGARVIMASEFQIATDGSGNNTTTIGKVYLEKNENDITEVASPDNVGIVNGVQVASWLKPPLTFVEKNGKLASKIIEFNAAGGDVLNPLFAAALSPNYSNANAAFFESLQERTLTVNNGLYYSPLGPIRRVLIQVNHSGNQGNSSVINAAVSAGNPPSILVPVSLLAGADLLDSEYLQLVEKTGARAVPQVSTAAPVTSSATLLFRNVSIANSGAIPNDTKLNPGEDLTLIDGDAVSFVVAESSKSLDAGQIDFTAPIIPANIDPNATLNSVVFKFRHGAGTESGSDTGQILVLTANPLAVIEGPGTFSQSASIVEESATIDALNAWIAAGRVVGELQDLIFQIRALEDGPWSLYEGFIEINYTQSTADAPTSSVVNHFNITDLIADWDDFVGFVVQITRPNTTALDMRIYQVSLIVIYAESEDKMPDELFIDLTGGLTGNQIGLIQSLWTSSNLGNQSVNYFDSASLAQAISDASAYTNLDFSGYFQNETVFEAMILIAKAGSFVLSRWRGSIYLDFIQNAYAPSPVNIDDSEILNDDAVLEGADTQNEVLQTLFTEYEFSDRLSYSSIREQVTAANAYPNSETKEANRFIKSATAIFFYQQKRSIREGRIFKTITLVVDKSFSFIRPGDIFSIDFGFLTTGAMEIRRVSYDPRSLRYELNLKEVE